jgi:tRNA1Val (adenine37-N6)-methyltransferase
VLDESTLSCDRLTRDYWLYQRKRGHRFSSDDVITAWAALQVVASPQRVLDLGCGIGSVLLHLAWCVSDASFVGIEAQDISFELLLRNIDHNHAGDRVTVHHGDLRDENVIAQVGTGFDLVTGTPPYFPLSTSVEAMDSQRAYARIEFRGGVEAYIATARRVMTPTGVVVLCGDSDAEIRVVEEAARQGLSMVRRWVVVPREGERPLFTVWALGMRAAVLESHTLTLRGPNGERTEDALRMRTFSGID